MKTNLFTIFATLALSTAVATTSQAKIGDTFIDPEYGKITVKGPAFENDNGQNRDIVDGKLVANDTPQSIYVAKNGNVSRRIDKVVKKIHPNLTKSEITAITQEFIGIFQTLKGFRKTFYIDGYNETMLGMYPFLIRDAQRAFTYDFLDYYLKIEGTPEFEQLKKEINFSTQILKNLKLYEE